MPTLLKRRKIGEALRRILGGNVHGFIAMPAHVVRADRQSSLLSEWMLISQNRFRLRTFAVKVLVLVRLHWRKLGSCRGHETSRQRGFPADEALSIRSLM
jgi:hypothetical protein